MFQQSILESIPTDLQNSINSATKDIQIREDAIQGHFIQGLQTLMPCHFCGKDADLIPIKAYYYEFCHPICEDCIINDKINECNECYRCYEFLKRNIIFSKDAFNQDIKTCLSKIFSNQYKRCRLCFNNVADNQCNLCQCEFKSARIICHKTFYGEKNCFVCYGCYNMSLANPELHSSLNIIL